MKLHTKCINPIAFISILLIICFSHSSYAQEQLNIKVTNIKKNSGKVIVEIYNSKTKWLETPYKKVVLSANQEVQIASFQVPYGKYAVTVYQDINSNNETDMNFIGIPKEPVGFGNNYKPFGEPKFESTLIDFKFKAPTPEIKLYKVF